MKDLIKNIESSYEEMTNSHKMVAQYIAKNYKNIAFLTLDEVAGEIGVSTTTVIRFVRSIGFNGYSNFVDNIKDFVKLQIGLPERIDVSSSYEGHEELLIRSFEQDILNINETLSGLNPEILEQCVNAIKKAKRIYVIGFRSSFCLSHYLSIALGQIRDNVRLVQGVGYNIPEEIIGVNKDDVCIAISFPRHAKVTYDVADWMKKQGAKVITITDSMLSPLVNVSDMILPCKVSRIAFKNSLTAPLSLINYIINSIALNDKENAFNTLSKAEELLQKGQFFLNDDFL